MRVYVGFKGLAITASKAELPLVLEFPSETEVVLRMDHKTFTALEEVMARVRDGQRALGPTEFNFNFQKGVY